MHHKAKESLKTYKNEMCIANLKQTRYSECWLYMNDEFIDDLGGCKVLYIDNTDCKYMEVKIVKSLVDVHQI